METRELIERINRIEIREGKERTIKSYVLRNNVLSDKAKRVLHEYMEKYGLFYSDSFLDYSAVFGNGKELFVAVAAGFFLLEMRERRFDVAVFALIEHGVAQFP